MRLLLVVSLVLETTIIFGSAQTFIEFCAHDLKGTESGKEDHYVIVRYQTYGDDIFTTEEQNMEDSGGCWTRRFPFDFNGPNTKIIAHIYEADGVGNNDDLGYVETTSYAIAFDRDIVKQVASGGELTFRLQGTIPPPTTTPTTTIITTTRTTTSTTEATTTTEPTTERTTSSTTEKLTTTTEGRTTNPWGLSNSSRNTFTYLIWLTLSLSVLWSLL